MEYIKTGNIISGIFKDKSGLDLEKQITAEKRDADWLKRGRIDKCYNCKHYKQHYCEVKTATGSYFNAIYFGHCSSGKRTKNVKPDYCCEKFELTQGGYGI